MNEVTYDTNREPSVNPSDAETVETSEADALNGGAASSGGSEANALRHGLTAAKHLPKQIEHRSAEILTRLLAERQPKKMDERLLLSDVARRFATLEFIRQCEISALIVGGRNALKIAEATLPPHPGGELIEVGQDDFLMAAVSSEFLEKLIRYRRGHERSLCWSLKYLEMMTASQRTEARRLTVEDCRSQFPDAAACASYLVSRSEREKWRCPRCDSHAARHWLKNRRRWECSNCAAQIGVRHSTVMANSPIPIEKWFWATLLVGSHPGTTTLEIADALNLSRVATAKRIRGAIETALQSPRSLELLMGLPALAARMVASPETSVDFKPILQNETVPT